MAKTTAQPINTDDPFNVKERTKTGVVGRKLVDYGWSGKLWENDYGQVRDTNAMAGQVAVNYGKKADASIAGMIGAAQNGINTLNSQAGSVYPYIQQAEQAYGAMGQGIQGSYQAANDVRGVGNQISPFMQTFRGYGDTLWNQGNALLGTGNQIIGQGQGILNMNAGMGGLGGEYVKWLQGINPDSFVSMAAVDTQRAGQNTQAQMDRGLSRSGVDAAGSRSMALRQQYQQALASAIAGAKTRARFQGKQMQGQALQSGVQTANALLGQGSQIAGQGLQAQGMAGQMQGQAVQAGQAAGQMFNAAGQLQGQSAQLQGQQGAGYGNLVSEKNQTLGLTLQAQNNLTAAQQAAAQYYAQTGQGFGQVAGSGGIMSALFGS
jgi:hypothetical protein